MKNSKTYEKKHGIEGKVLVIGLDGATFKLMRPWLDHELLPFMAKLKTEGTSGCLETIFPSISPIAWACFYTGKNPAKLGEFTLGFIDDVKHASQMDAMNASCIESRTLWGILSEYKKTVGVVNIPSTYPPETVNGFLISGYLTPISRKDYFYPPSIANYLENYEIDVQFHRIGELPHDNVDKEWVLGKLYSIMRKRTIAVERLLKKYNPDIYITNFKEIDTLQHLFWDKPNIMLSFYKKVDEYIQQLFVNFQPDYVFLISDHGFHKAEKQYFNVNTWLEKWGYLKRSKSVRGRMLSFLYLVGTRLGKYEFVRKLIPTRLKEKAEGELVGPQINFELSTAYGSQWGVFIHPKIRKSADYPTFRDKIMKELEKLVDPKTKSKVFKYIINGNDEYKGNLSLGFPDIILVPEPDYQVNPNLSDKVFDPRMHRTYLTGAHKSDKYGIFIAWGKSIKEGHKAGGLKIVDVAPTILYLFGIPIPTDIDGNVMSDIFVPSFLRRNKILYEEVKGRRILKKRKISYTHDEKEELKQRLRELGYIE